MFFKKYNVSIKIFKQIGQFKRLTVKYIIQNKKKMETLNEKTIIANQR